MQHELPDARSGLPKPLERRLLRAYADTALHRMGAAAVLRALGVLVRKHPGAAFDAARAAIAQAGRVGYGELKHALLGRREQPSPESPRLGKRKLRRLRKMLDGEATAPPQRSADGSEKPAVNHDR